MIIELLADGLEEIEALTPVDILRRAGCDVRMVSIGDSRMVRGSHGIIIEADRCNSDVYGLLTDGLEMVILPGGMPGTVGLDHYHKMDMILKFAHEKGAYMAAICAAPRILGKRGYLKGKRATCYPGNEEYLEGAELSEDRVVTDGNIITSRGMGTALEFSLELCRILKGEAEAEKLKRGVIAR